ncbi:DUF2784 domain-containing protein [Dyella sp. M7H15-1]|uniref:DUF2784 domain-containing protein n=1 Tax=Dyella sp. M7H15-1 TaxID=2501295 RepID=UPI001005211D|nr:DUF2784 domain-containing protein [Dyella sp. M7H15-1]QAU24695.1 DUF2784 domain-containing protein [Dyella sp. M7H15-1]
MLSLIVVDVVLTLHLGFILFCTLGALLALKWRWIPWFQLPAAAWGFYVELSGRICPLTSIENHFREQAGWTAYQGDFIRHYLLTTIYPNGLTREIQYFLAAFVLLLNVSVYAWLIRQSLKNAHPT